MIPIIVITAAGLLGLFVWGFWGLVFGVFSGYVVTLIIGVLAWAMSGGLLPRKVRRATANSFMTSHSGLVRAAYGGVPEPEKRRVVEASIEAIFRRASVDNRSIDQMSAFTRDAIQSATNALVEEESRPEMKSCLLALEQHIEDKMYPS